MSINSNEIQTIVDKVMNKLASEGELPPSSKDKWTSTKSSTSSSYSPSAARGVYNSVNEAVEAAKLAYNHLNNLPLKTRGKIIEAIREYSRKNTNAFSQMAHEETGLGRAEDKIHKNSLVIEKTPGIEDIKPIAFTGDHGFTLVEWAPYGVIGSITPCTNPTETIICNAIGMIAAGNSVVFNAHPTAKKVSAFCIEVLNDAIISAGGPPDLLTCIASPTIQSAQELMSHKNIRLLVVTGGGAVVKAAMATEKKCIAAGPGNPPAVVDETADIPKAARDIVAGASLDNNIICIAEKEVIVVESVADQLVAEMVKNNCYKLSTYQAEKLRKVLLPEMYPDGLHGKINRYFVGKKPSVILREIGIDVSDDIRLAIAEVDRNHPFVWSEMLMPVMPIVRVKNVDEAIDFAYEVEQGNFHTATMHSKNIDNLSKMARKCNTSIFVKNAPSYAGLGFGGEGFTSFTIASPTGEGLTTAKDFGRERRCTLADYFRII
ncbi:MAG: aldehyde dehydrogenase family protein [Cyanobacteriota bacterium]